MKIITIISFVTSLFYLGSIIYDKITPEVGDCVRVEYYNSGNAIEGIVSGYDRKSGYIHILTPEGRIASHYYGLNLHMESKEVDCKKIIYSFLENR
jgi:hypothetical protein